MRRFALTALVAFLTFGLAAMPVSAGKGWCRSDPIVSLNGVQLQFWISIPIENLADVLGPISIVLVAPGSSNMTLVATDAGFNGHGEAIYLVSSGQQIATDGSFTVTALVSVQMRGNQVAPMLVEVVPDAGDSAFVSGQTVGVSVTVTVLGSTISNTVTLGGSG